MEIFTAIACLFGITAVLSFVNDRYLRLQTDIGLLLLAVLTTLGLRVLEVFVPSGAIDLLRQLTHSFNLNDTLLKGVLCFMLFRGSVNVRWANLREQRWLVLSLAFAGTAMACLLTGSQAWQSAAAGLRGGLSLALAVSLPDSSWKPLILNMTFAAVVFSIVVQGLTIQPHVHAKINWQASCDPDPECLVWTGGRK